MYSRQETTSTQVMKLKRRLRCLCLTAWCSMVWWCVPQVSLAVAPPIQAEDAELLWRQVGWMTDQSDPCPAAGGGWQAAVELDLMGERFCIYEFQGGAVTAQDILGLASLVGLDALGADHMAVSPMGGLNEVLTTQQSLTFQEQSGDTFLPPVGFAGTVRLGLLDTQPDNVWIDLLGDETSEHGKSLRRWSQNWLCKNPTCLVTSHSRLALAYRTFHATDAELAVRDEVHGGVVGTIAELGQAIVADVEGEGLGVGGPSARRVINLSVAWDGSLFGGLQADASGDIDPSSMPVDVRLVFRALQHAADSGALVIAAAGNRSDHLQAEGPLLPAAWERVPASPVVGVSMGLYRPLVYAVAAVDSMGRDVGNAQPASRPPLVAYGDHAVWAAMDPEVPTTATLTGSSVAAMVVSSAAAAAWAYAPWLDAAEIMERVYASGDILTGATVDFCLADPESDACAMARPFVRRISVCRAVDAVCAFTEGCPAPFDSASPSPCAPWMPVGTEYSDELMAEFVPAAVTSISTIVPVLPTPEECGDVPMRDGAYPPAAEACPSWQFNGQGATPWVNPQPGSTPCPNCPLVRGHLSVDVGEHLLGIAKNPTLVLCGFVLNLPMPDLGTGFATTHQVQGIPVPPDCPRGLLAFTTEDEDGNVSATVSPIQIVH